MPDISEISTCTNKEVKFWLSTITMLKYSPLVPLILFKLRANYSCVKGLTRPNQQNETQFDDFFRLLFSFSVYFNFSVFIDSLTCDLSVDETFLSFFLLSAPKEILLRSQCHTSTFSLRWKTRWFYYFSLVFFKETFHSKFLFDIFFYFSLLLPRSWTHYSSIIITTSFISEKFVIKSKYTFGFHWRDRSFYLIQCFFITHHTTARSLVRRAANSTQSLIKKLF